MILGFVILRHRDHHKMFDHIDISQFKSDSQFLELLTRLSCQSIDAESVSMFLQEAISSIKECFESENVVVTRMRKGNWETIAAIGNETIPIEACSEALDREQLVERDGWWVVPMSSDSGSHFVLCISQPQIANSASLQSLANFLKSSMTSVVKKARAKERISRLEALLEISSDWSQAHDADAMLQQMAETATNQLRAERASVFLWDRGQKSLVARPALGVEDEDLRIPEDAGIVGQVVQTGEPRRVDMDIRSEQEEIHRDVDARLGFHTKSLLCVPLRGHSGELFGAFEAINKIDGNFTDDDEIALSELAMHAGIALENRHERERLLNARNQMADQAAEQVQLIGQCPSIDALRSTVQRVADTELAILILGENGTGKEVVSQSVHYLSRRRNEPFVAVNCAALTETLLESELFGHEKGAFTDAHESRAGKFELASGGTLFLDEIGDMSLGGQAKLLRVLEEQVVVRVGGSQPIHTDVRVIAATNQDLAKMVREKEFREDLFFRLNVVTIELPPLRERGDDVMLLADHFLREFCVKARRKPLRFTAAARKRLLGHDWPGNIRELRNLMERLAYLSQDDKVDVTDLAFVLSRDDQSPALFSLDLPLTEATRQFQIEDIKKQVERTRGNMTEAANRLGLHRSNLYRKMRQLEIPTQE